MGFLSFFSKKTEKIELDLNVLPEFIEKNSKPMSNKIELEAKNILSEIKFLLKDAKVKLNDLKSVSLKEEGSIKLRRITNTSKKEIERKLSNLIEKLMPPKAEDLNSLREYAFNSTGLLSKEILLFSKNLAYTSILLKSNTRDIGKTFDELNGKFNELIKLFQENFLLFELNKKKKLNDLIEISSFLKHEKTKITELEKLLSKNREEFNALTNKLSHLRNSNKFKELNELKAKKENLLKERSLLDSTLLQYFSFLEKPYRKLLKLKPELIDLNLKSFFDLLLKNPLTAIKSDAKNQKIKEISDILTENISLLNLDAKKQKKLVEKTLLLKDKDFFSDFFWKENKIRQNINSIEKQLHSITVLNELNSLEQSIKEFSIKIKKQENTLSSAKKLFKTKLKNVFSLRDELQDYIKKVLKKEVKINLQFDENYLKN